MVECPECSGPVAVDDEEELDVGDVLECEECGALLKVTGVNPTEIKVEAEDDEAHRRTRATARAEAGAGPQG